MLTKAKIRSNWLKHLKAEFPHLDKKERLEWLFLLVPWCKEEEKKNEQKTKMRIMR